MTHLARVQQDGLGVVAGNLFGRGLVQGAAHHVPEGVALRHALGEVEGAGAVDGARREAVPQGGHARLALVQKGLCVFSGVL